MRLIAENLGIERGGRRILANVSFAIEAGALFVTGPNGAGKSSLLRALAGLLRPAEGAVRFEGADALAAPFHYLGHRDGLKASLTARENLDFAAAFLGRGEGAAAPSEALAALGVGHAADAPAAWLSAGQKRRVALARLLVAPRPLWLLDEPVTALDAASTAAFEALASAHLAGGGLIVAAVHARLAFPARELRLGPA